MVSRPSKVAFVEVPKLGFASNFQVDEGLEATCCAERKAGSIPAAGPHAPEQACTCQDVDRAKAKAESLWQNYFKYPMGWWDNRNNKLHAKSPDFRHKTTKAVLWVDDPNTPQWVAEALQKKNCILKPARSKLFPMGVSACSESGLGNLKTCEQEEVFWMAVLMQHAKCGRHREVLRVYEKMGGSAIEPTPHTFVALLKACSSLQDMQSGKLIHEEVVKRGMETDLFVGTMLVDMYAKCRSLVDAQLAFDKITSPDVVSWNALILGYAQMDKGEEALQLYTKMQQEGVAPDSWTYVSALKACSSLAGVAENAALKVGCLRKVRTIHAHVVEAEFELDEHIGTMLVDVYAKCGSLEDARYVFEKMLHRDVVCWTAMISGYVQLNMGEEALELYARMEIEGVVADERTYVIALKACSSCVASDYRKGGHGILARQKCLEIVRGIHANVEKRMLESDAFVGNMLVDAYAKCGSLEEARRVFDNMPDPTVVSWTAMICGYAQMDEGDLALQFFTRMQQKGVIPNERTYVGVLSACGSMAGLEKGKEIHMQILSDGLVVMDSFLQDSLISMYGKCGSMKDAQQVFDLMPAKELVAWNALIAGYAQEGRSELVFDLFQRMLHEGLQPDSTTFLGVLTLCGHAGLVDQATMYFSIMSKDYGITPGVKHYTCMIDLLGRAGHLDKALKMVEAMPCQPHSAVWRCLLAACQKWRAVELGRQIFELAVKLEEGDAAPYILMSNIYLASEMLPEARAIQAMRTQSRAWKEPGQSRWADLDGITHTFVAGDREHCGNGEIHTALRDILFKLKSYGLTPHHDSSDEAADEESG